METKLFSAAEIHEAGQLLNEGHLVAFPTETVYGLAAIASNDEAVQEVYRVKGRPSDNPLIVHVANKDIAQFVKEVPEEAYVLMDAYWPGPLTLIFNAKEGVFAPTVTVGRSTVSLRMPDQPLALELIEATGFPVVGPSANTSGKPSPTSAAHVMHDFSGKIAGVVDGGATNIGVESTVLDLTDERGPIILRPGAITKEMLEETLGQKVWQGGDISEETNEEMPKAPGMKYTHYAPKQPIILVNGKIEDWVTVIDSLTIQGKKIGLLAADETIEDLSSVKLTNFTLGKKENIEEASQRLYAGLRYFDETDVEVILAEAYPKTGIGTALMNRLEKAATLMYP